jgi:hypothetical protein
VIVTVQQHSAKKELADSKQRINGDSINILQETTALSYSKKEETNSNQHINLDNHSATAFS